jgi:hypothetical protein
MLPLSSCRLANVHSFDQVITSVAYKTHPNPSHVQVAWAQFNATDEGTMRRIFHDSLQGLAIVTDAGYTGYGAMSSGSLGLLFIQPNGTNETYQSSFTPFYRLAAMPNVTAQIGSFDFPSWIDYCNVFLSDQNIATNVVDTSRLLTAEVLMDRTDDLVDAAFGYEGFSAGFNFSKRPALELIMLQVLTLAVQWGK